SLDDVATGEMAADHLLDCRIERFAFYRGNPDWVTSTNRYEGFRNRLEQKGFACALSPMPWPSGLEWLTHAHRPALMTWLRELPKPCGILAVDDSAAIDLAEACQEAEIGVPDDIAILGVNNDDLLCEVAWPPLSSVDADFSRVGYHAAKLLSRMLAGDKLDPAERIVRLPPLGVVRRMSTSVLAVGDPNLADAVRYIRQHACDPCTVHDVLRHVPVARRWLERQFVAQFGRTPHDEITRVRIEAAKRMLLQPDIALQDVTQRCGFSGVQNLARVFRQVTGDTPAAFRRASMRNSGLAL
ncbi:MAG TPA: substrate-binding domain-containing protein, partial [Tepidisphaeraceae bacterium]